MLDFISSPTDGGADCDGRWQATFLSQPPDGPNADSQELGEILRGEECGREAGLWLYEPETLGIALRVGRERQARRIGGHRVCPVCVE